MLLGSDPGLRTGPFRPTWGTLAGALVVGALVIAPAAGVALAVLVAVTMAVPRTRPILRILPVLLVAVGALYVLALQTRWGYPAGFFWPRNFARVHRIVMAGPILMAVLAWTDARRPDPEPVAS